jgi:signal transduction histidine kinase/ActR/RegA family two-component response regulator
MRTANDISINSSRWIGKIALIALVLCVMLVWLNIRQNATMQRISHALFNLRKARIDLAHGFMHISFSGESTSPYSHEQGLALVAQALNAFERAAEFESVQPLLESLRSESNKFYLYLRQLRQIDYSGRDKTALRIVFHQLERQAETLENAVGQKLKGLSDDQNRDFNLAVLIAVVLLGTICSVVFVIEKRAVEREKNAAIEHEQLQQQLQQAQKLEAVGRLAGGVAHDFNNMLGVILGYSELAREKLDQPEFVTGCLDEITNAGKRSASLTHQLLAFARKQPIIPQILQVNEAVGEMLKMLVKLVGANNTILWAPQVDLWPIKIDPAQFDQILINLCVNARDAISDVGKIEISTANFTANPDSSSSGTVVEKGDYVLLSVADNGCGMDEDTKKRIFEPFFTTKGHGTGLGLATVYGIVKQNSGFIEINSSLGAGTVFNIYLPRHNESFVIEKASRPSFVSGGTETLLLVEDDFSTLRMIKKMLEKSGYEVYTASSPAEALTVAENNRSHIALLITDVILPDMNGKDLSRRINAIIPGIRTLFISGYSMFSPDNQPLYNEAEFLQKPFSSADMAARVRSLIDLSRSTQPPAEV